MIRRNEEVPRDDSTDLSQSHRFYTKQPSDYEREQSTGSGKNGRARYAGVVQRRRRRPVCGEPEEPEDTCEAACLEC